jgi:hypothetical protein
MLITVTTWQELTRRNYLEWITDGMYGWAQTAVDAEAIADAFRAEVQAILPSWMVFTGEDFVATVSSEWPADMAVMGRWEGIIRAWIEEESVAAWERVWNARYPRA